MHGSTGRSVLAVRKRDRSRRTTQRSAHAELAQSAPPTLHTTKSSPQRSSGGHTRYGDSEASSEPGCQFRRRRSCEWKCCLQAHRKAHIPISVRAGHPALRTLPAEQRHSNGRQAANCTVQQETRNATHTTDTARQNHHNGALNTQPPCTTQPATIHRTKCTHRGECRASARFRSPAVHKAHDKRDP
jgi:hypothetical protein